MLSYTGCKMCDFEIDGIVSTIKKNGYRTIALQFPEGLKDHAGVVVDGIRSRAEVEIVVSSNPCYGACDLADEEMKALGAEVLFHFGHAPLLKGSAIPVEYIEVRMDADPRRLLSENLGSLEKKVGLITTVQHVHKLKDVRDFLEEEGFSVSIGLPKGRARYPGHVLGCSFEAAKTIADDVDCFAYIGSGIFHPLGVALATGKKVVVFDILSGEVSTIDEEKERIMRVRFGHIARAKDAETFGIIIGEKRGQKRRGLALALKEMIEKAGKKAYLISAFEITPENLISFRNLDALVNTACPRITIDDAARYKQPLLTPPELEIVLGERLWEDYVLDEF